MPPHAHGGGDEEEEIIGESTPRAQLFPNVRAVLPSFLPSLGLMRSSLCRSFSPSVHAAVVRTDGPPFVDLKAGAGKGFEVDYVKVSKHLGQGKVRHAGRGREGEEGKAILGTP
jgi:hypothetical protein